MSNTSYPNVLASALATSWHMLPSSLESTVLPVVQRIANGEVAQMRSEWLQNQGLTEQDARAQMEERQTWGRLDSDGNPIIFTGGSRIKFTGQSTAIVPINGPIFKRANIFMMFSGGTSADMLRSAVKQLLEMDTIKNVVLHVDSPGGSVNGLVLATNALRVLAQNKNMLSVADDLNASAAFMLSSVAPILVNPSSITGSIGTIAVLENRARQLEAEGRDIFVVRSKPSRMKSVPNSFEPVTDKGLEEVQSAVDKHFGDFIKAVSLNMGITMNEAIEKAAEGRTFEGEQAIEAGLADGEGTLESAVEQLETKSERRMFAFIGAMFEKYFGTPQAANPPEELIDVVPSENSDQSTKQDNESMSNENPELAALKAELEEKNTRIQAIEEEKAADAIATKQAANRIFVEALQEEGRIKPLHAERLNAVLNAVDGIEGAIEFSEADAKVEESVGDSIRAFLETLEPIISLGNEDSPALTKADLDASPFKTAQLLQQMVREGKANSPAQAMNILRSNAAA